MTRITILAMLLAACGPAAPPSDTGEDETTGGSEEPAPDPAIEAAERSEIEGEQPAVAFENRGNARIDAGQPVALRITVANLELGEGGNHVHLVYDHHAPIMVHDVSEPIDLGELLAANGHELTEGWHLVRMFASRASHESLKVDSAYDTFSFFYGEAPPRAEWDPLSPTLTYSQPIGCYAGADAARILLDFYVMNADLAENGHKVRVSVDGEHFGELVTDWVPYYLTNLPPGEHTVRLELLDALGQLEVEPFNDAEHTITVAAEGGCP